MRKRIQAVFSSPIATIFFVFLLIVICSYFIPAGQFDRTVDPVSGITIVDGESYHTVDKVYLTPLGIFECIFQGFIDASDIIMLCFFSSFYIRVITESGSFTGAISSLIHFLGRRKNLILPLMIIAVSLCGFSYGETEDIYPLVPLFVATSIMVGYDGMIGVAISGGAVSLGFAASAFNPYTLGVAQQIAELPMFSGAWFRSILYVILLVLYIWWVMRYASRLEKGKIKSLVSDIDYSDLMDTKHHFDFGWKQKTIMIGFAVIVLCMIYGAMTLGWYFKEIGALFLMGGVFSALLMRYNTKQFVALVVEGFRDIMLGVVAIGLARSILVAMTDTLIIDTVVYTLFLAVRALPQALLPVGMFFVQMLINFFIPSGSAQASASMPIMIPMVDLLEINRKVSVLAFQLGDGFSNLIWPTSSIAIMCGLGRFSLQRWYKFFGPFFGAMLLLACCTLFLANAIPLGPF